MPEAVKQINGESGPFILVSDDDGHDYIIPVSRRNDWDKWCDMDSYDCESWQVPNYAMSVDRPFISFPEFYVE